MTRPILDISNVSLCFGALRALDGVTLAVAPGERLALLGHNGAGKSTLFKAVLGFIAPGEGTISVAGHRPGSDAARIAMSYLPEVVSFPQSLTGREVLTYFSGLRGASRAAIGGLLERVGLAEAAERRVRTYSKGMRQRLGLAQALIGTPRLMLLDEPTSGLDPVARQDFYAVLTEIAARGSSVLLSSHGLEEVQGQTDRVAILSRGRLRACGTLAELAAAAALRTTICVTAKQGHADRLHADLGGRRVNGCRIEFDCTGDAKLGVLLQLGHHRDALNEIDVFAPGLNDIYRHFSGQQEDQA
ncbi:ABC transporter ATP-binding protein [Ponticoccus gilvus]|nr:ABC transporter ATP-binding protein [Enemella evansiae]